MKSFLIGSTRDIRLKPFLLAGTSLLVMGMVATADLWRQPDLIFPELAALAFGAWAMPARPWMASTLHMWLSPTLAALTGALVQMYVPLPFVPRLLIAFVCVVAELWLLRSALLPSISAAILPIVTGTANWSYPLGVCILMGIVALGCRLLDLSGHGNYAGLRPAPRSRATLTGVRVSLTRWSKIFLLVIMVATFAGLSGWTFCVAPPLIVACIEFVNPGAKLQRRPGSLFALMVIAASIGMLAALFAHRGFYPLWLAAGMATVAVYLLYWFLDLPCPPALALAVLPTIVPPHVLPLYPFEIILGCTAFFAVGKYLFRGE